MVTRRVTAIAAAAALLAGCGASSPRSAVPATTGPHPVTTAEADRLAVSRFLLYQGTGARVTATVSSAQGPLRLLADIDYRTHVGYGQISGTGSSFVLQWSARTLLAWPGGNAGTGTAPAAPPTARPASRPLDPSRTDTDAVLALVLQLGASRPDNAQLLRQGGARWLRHDTVAGTPVDVIAGPDAAGSGTGRGLVNYWITGRGALLRVQASVGGGAPVTIDIAPGAYRPFTTVDALN